MALPTTLAKYSLRNIPMEELRDLEPLWQVISYPEALERKVVAITTRAAGAVTGNPEIYLVLTNAYDAATETWGLRRITNQLGKIAEVVVTSPEDFEALLALHERAMRAVDSSGEAGNSDTVQNQDDLAAVITLSSLEAETSHVVRLVNSTLYDAFKLNASDIHWECDGHGLRVLYRLDGVLVQITEAAGTDTAEQVISRIKVMAELDIAERRIPQDGRFKVQVNDREIDFRVSVMPSIFGEDAVLRLLDRKSLTEEAQGLTLDSLGLSKPVMVQIRKLAAKPHGMLLVTGPTGSGKTTTLYASITEIHTGRDKIITIEDPVEYRLPRVLQIPVNEKKGLTFAVGLRSILRHDPDKIMVGEIRDNETAEIAVQAALTGHLVFTTVHANNVFDVLGRFLHMGVDSYSFAAALNGIVAQRLLRVNCSHCASPIEPMPEDIAALSLDHHTLDTWVFKAGKGCGHCRGTGYKGRRAVAEVLVLNDAIRELIAQRAPISAIKAEATKSGWVSLIETALQYAARGETTLAEVLRVAG